VTHDDLLPVSVEVRQKEKAGGVARLRDPLQNLADLLGPQTSWERLPYRDAAPDGSADPAATQTKLGIAGAPRPNGNRPENWKLAIAGFEDTPSGLTRERNHEVALPTSRDVRDNDRSQEFTRLRDSLQELTDILAPQRNRESAPCREKVPEEDPNWEDPAGPPLA
jgi:hypothetical protein